MTGNSHGAAFVALLVCVVFSAFAFRPVPMVELAVGSHVVSGRIVDTNGEGLAGVSVHLQLYDQAPRMAEPMSLGGEPPSVGMRSRG